MRVIAADATGMERDQRASSSPPPVKVVQISSADSDDSRAERPSRPHPHSARSAKTLITNRATVGPQQSLTKTQKWFMSARYLKLFFGTFLGVLALFISSYEGADEYLYGSNWEREWLWWIVAVPFYLFAAIYFARFVGSFLMRIWIWEIVNSPWVHGAVITLLTGILSEETADLLFAAALAKPAVVQAASTLTANVISSHQVQDACVNTVQGTLLSPKVHDAVVTSAQRLLKKPGLHQATADFIGDEVFTDPIARQAARIIQSEDVGEAVIGLMQQVLEDQEIRLVIKRRAESVAGDAELFVAGRRGLCEAMMGPPRPHADSTGSTSSSCLATIMRT